jgi:hypothetical protein
MTATKKIDQTKCMFCLKEILLFSAAPPTWKHLDTNKAESDTPFIHIAKPWVMEKG